MQIRSHRGRVDVDQAAPDNTLAAMNLVCAHSLDGVEKGPWLTAADLAWQCMQLSGSDGLAALAGRCCWGVHPHANQLKPDGLAVVAWTVNDASLNAVITDTLLALRWPAGGG